MHIINFSLIKLFKSLIIKLFCEYFTIFRIRQPVNMQYYDVTCVIRARAALWKIILLSLQFYTWKWPEKRLFLGIYEEGTKFYYCILNTTKICPEKDSFGAQFCAGVRFALKRAVLTSYPDKNGLNAGILSIQRSWAIARTSLYVHCFNREGAPPSVMHLRAPERALKKKRIMRENLV